MLIAILLILGLCGGSFVNALVWRLQNGLPIGKGRSQCPNCHTQLKALDLIPVLSWLALGGRCCYCKAPISKQYPIIELITAGVFVASYVFWPADLSANGQKVLLGSWLAASIGLIALALYDLKYMLLPNRLIYPTLATAAAGRLIYVVFYAGRPLHEFVWWGLSILVASGIFWLIFMVSAGKWIGYGDVRLGLITGTVLASPALAWAMLFFASLLGTLVALPDLLRGRKNLTHKLPFGPFLVVACGFTLLFGQPVLDWYKRLLGS